MNWKKSLTRHKLFFAFLVLFLILAVVDLLNFDNLIYQNICAAVFPFNKVPCAVYSDIPFWNSYLLLAVLTSLYHLHDEAKTTNRHLHSHK